MQHPEDRRWSWRRLAPVAFVALALAACAPNSPLLGQESRPSPGGPLKIGFISPATGKDMRDGWSLYWDQHGGKAAGREVVTVFEDDAGNPDTGLSKAKRLVDSENVAMVVGPLLANVGYVVADYVSKQGLPSIQAVAAADDLTQRRANPLVLRLGAFTSSQMNFPAGKWAYDQGYRTAVT